jgi:hypothetical protein
MAHEPTKTAKLYRISPKKAAEVLLRRAECLTDFIYNANLVPPKPPVGDRALLEKLLQSFRSDQKQHPSPTVSLGVEGDGIQAAVDGSYSRSESGSMRNMMDCFRLDPVDYHQSMTFDDISGASLYGWDNIPEFLGPSMGTFSGYSTSEGINSNNRGSLAEMTMNEDSQTPSGDENTDIYEHVLLDQISDRMGQLHLTPDGQLRYYGATSNFNLGGSLWNDVTPDISFGIAADNEQANIHENIDSGEEAHLEALFFHWQDPAYHVVDQPMYYHGKALWGNRKEDSTFYSCLLENAMYEILPVKTRIGMSNSSIVAPLGLCWILDNEIHDNELRYLQRWLKLS